MSTLRTESLSISGFRGISRRLNLEFGRRLTIIYGGNASGKSSIAQAIEFAISGQILDQEDEPIPQRFLKNLSSEQHGEVVLTVSNGNSSIPLAATTNENRNAIESRFRTVGSVDWPERQHVPITTTHLTSQGSLARLLMSDSVTRNDLSGLCAGAYLRFLVGRAERLADTFRQGSGGRNIQADIKDARSAHDAARVLLENLSAIRGPIIYAGLDAPQLVTNLAREAGLQHESDLSVVVSTIEKRNEQLDKKLTAVQRLLLRMGDLGQYEVELSQLRALLNDLVAREIDLTKTKEDLELALKRSREAESSANEKKAAAIATMAAHEQYRQAATAINSLINRMEQAQLTISRIAENIASVSALLGTAEELQRSATVRVVELESKNRRFQEQLQVVIDGLSKFAEIPDDALRNAQSRLTAAEKLLQQLRAAEMDSSKALEHARVAEISADDELKRVSQDDGRFITAVAELRSFIEGEACSLCGHNHGDEQTLNRAIDACVENRLSSATALRSRFEQATAARRSISATHNELIGKIQSVERERLESYELLTRLQIQRRRVVDQTQTALARLGCDISVSVASLSKLKDDVTGSATQLGTDLEAARNAHREAVASCETYEHDLAYRSVEREQQTRLATELQQQIDGSRRNMPKVVHSTSVQEAHDVVAAADNLVAESRRNAGGANARLAEVDRALAETIGQRTSTQRRLEVINGQLRALDSELSEVGATRDVAALVDLESKTRRERDVTIALRGRIAIVREQLSELERSRAYAASEKRFVETRERLDRLLDRQAKLSKRADHFSLLRQHLEQVQGATAEAVLSNVRVPVDLMFRAMTAGCQWNIEFVLNEGGRMEARLIEGSANSSPANAILNSAYLNVAAIALRVGLASQQNWTSLQTVVLDDPILEMDSLTQSALIDGLEAILTSTDLPWSRLQFVITTWSEDFAVLAAHKLAHMNARSNESRDDFLLYRLQAGPDGTVTPERHAPRWKERASAA